MSRISASTFTKVARARSVATPHLDVCRRHRRRPPLLLGRAVHDERIGIDLIGGPLPAGLYRVKLPSTWTLDAPEPDGRKDFNVAWAAIQLWRYAVCA